MLDNFQTKLIFGIYNQSLDRKGKTDFVHLHQPAFRGRKVANNASGTSKNVLAAIISAGRVRCAAVEVLIRVVIDFASTAFACKI